MSKQSAQLFLEKIVSDERLRVELFGADGSVSVGATISAERLAEIGRREGFSFSAHEIVEAHAGELADSALEHVTGGTATSGAGAGKIKFNEFTIKKTSDSA